MKIRNGFVSNSSSSSFIIGIGRVSNMGKLITFLKSRCDEKINWQIPFIETFDVSEDGSKLLDQNQKPMDNYSGCTNLINHPKSISITCEYSKASANCKKQPGATYCCISVHNNEGDNNSITKYSYDGEEMPEDYFDEFQRQFLHLNEEHGISEYSATFGAGRNG